MAVYLLVYFLALLVGVLANVLLDVQLRRPGLGKTLGLVALVVFILIASSLTNIPYPEWLLLFWAAIGLLAGLGSSHHGSSL